MSETCSSIWCQSNYSIEDAIFSFGSGYTRSMKSSRYVFFYDYDELIMLKANILGRMASWLERNVEFK